MFWFYYLASLNFPSIIYKYANRCLSKFDAKMWNYTFWLLRQLLTSVDSVWNYKFLSQLDSFVFSLSIKNRLFPQFASFLSCVTVPYAISLRTFRLSCDSNLIPLVTVCTRVGFLQVASSEHMLTTWSTPPTRPPRTITLPEHHLKCLLQQFIEFR